MDIAVTKQAMQKTLEILRVDLASIRTGKATPALVEDVIVSVYGGSTRLKIKELVTITILDSQTLVIIPFDASIIGEIQKGIMEANIGLNPSSDGQNIRISIPPLSEERRGELIKLMHQKLENGRIMVRQVRHEAMQEIKKSFGHAQDHGQISEDEKERIEKEVQKVTDETNAEIDAMGKKKEEELIQI